MKIKGKQISNNTITESKLNLSKLTINSVTDNSVVLNIQGVNGQLFSIYDTLVGDLFTVSDISGMPILNVNSDENVDINGNLNLSGSLKNLNGDLIFTDNGGTYTLSEIINNPTTVISTEASVRLVADLSLSTRVSTEEVTRTSADTSLTTRITAEESTRLVADTSLTTRITAEESTRLVGVTSLTTRITAEESTRTSADTSLTTRITAEESTRLVGVTSLTTRVSTEEVTRTSADTSLTTRITAEESTRLAGVTSLTSSISAETVSRISTDASLTSNNNSLTAAISGEINSRISSDVSLSTGLSITTSIAKGAQQAIGFADYSAMVTYLLSVDYAELNIGQSIYINTIDVPDIWISEQPLTNVAYTYTTDSQLISDVNSGSGKLQIGYTTISFLETQKVDLTNYATTSALSTAISTEASNRISADTSLSTGLSQRVSTDASLSSGLLSEAYTRIVADNTLSTAILTEMTSRIASDNILSTAISKETTSRISTDLSLGNEISRIDNTLYNETSSRIASDNILSTAISTETSTRIAVISNYIPYSAASGLDVNTAKKLRLDNTIVDGASGLQFAQYSGGDNPGGEWYSHLIMNHGNANGYYVDLMSSFHEDVMYMRRKISGVVQPEKRFVMQGDSTNFSNLYVGTGSNAKVTISDGGYIGINSINANDNLILRAKGAGGLLLNYGSTGSHVGFYDGTTQIGYINATEAYFGNNLTIIGSASINGSLTTSKLFDTSRKKQYIFENYTGGWVRIAKLSVPSTGEAVGTISIANSFGYSHSVSTTFSFGVTYRNLMPWVTQLGATNVTLPKVRIVSPTNANTDYYIEVYYIAVGGPNLFYIQLSNEHNVELLNSFTNGEIPAGYVGREFIMNHYGISTHSILVGNHGVNGDNRIETNDAGYLSLTTTGNELTIGKTHAGELLYINYRQPKTGTAPTTYIWNKGNSTEYADHRVGSLTANAIRFNSNYTTNYISGDSYGILFSGTQYIHFSQTGFNYFQSKIVARDGITNDSGNYVALNKQTYVDGHIEFKNKLQSLDTGILGGNTAFRIRGVNGPEYSSGIAFDTFHIEYPETAYSYKERMRIFSNGNVAIGSDYDIGYKLVVSGSTYIEDGLVVSGTTYIQDGLNVEGNTILYGGLSLFSDGYIQGGLYVVGNTTLYSTLSLNSGISINGPINVSSTTKVNNLNSDRVDGYHFWSGTQSQYDAITPKDGNTIYFII